MSQSEIQAKLEQVRFLPTTNDEEGVDLQQLVSMDMSRLSQPMEPISTISSHLDGEEVRVRVCRTATLLDMLTTLPKLHSLGKTLEKDFTRKAFCMIREISLSIRTI